VQSDQWQHWPNQPDSYGSSGAMQVRSLSGILSLSLAFEVRRGGFSFSQLVTSLSPLWSDMFAISWTILLQMPICPAFHGFRLLGYDYDFVWAVSVTHEGCVYPDVILPKKQAMILTDQTHHHQPFACYIIEDGTFSMYFCVAVYMACL